MPDDLSTRLEIAARQSREAWLRAQQNKARMMLRRDKEEPAAVAALDHCGFCGGSLPCPDHDPLNDELGCLPDAPSPAAPSV